MFVLQGKLHVTYALIVGIIILSCMEIITGYEVHVSLYDEDGEEHWHYDDVIEDWNVTSYKLKDAQHQGQKTRYSRSACLDQLHDARVLALGSKTILPCHFCGGSSSFVARTWYRFSRELNIKSHQIQWRVVELPLDMHDNENLNRIYTRPDHSLIIKDFQPADTGTYFCEKYDPKSVDIAKYAFTSQRMQELSAASMALAWKKFMGDKHTKFLFHLDVEVPVKAHFVSAEGGSHRKASPPIKNEKGNWEAYTEWAEWSKCDVCGSIGERKRKGSCRVRRLHAASLSSPAYLDEVLVLYPEGAPCHSSLFQKHHVIINRVPEIEVEKCRETCPGRKSLGMNISAASSIMNQIKIKTSAIKKGGKIIKETIEKNQGDSVIISCPKAPVDSAVMWKNDSRPLYATEELKKSHGRIEIDVNSILKIRKVGLFDSGTYTCSYDGAERGEIKLKVNEVIQSIDIFPWIYYLLVSYAVDFVIFVFCMCVRHRFRTVQITFPQPRKPKSIPGQDSESSSSESEGSGQRKSRQFSKTSLFSMSAENIQSLSLTSTITAPGKELISKYPDKKFQENYQPFNKIDETSGTKTMLSAANSRIRSPGSYRSPAANDDAYYNNENNMRLSHTSVGPEDFGFDGEFSDEDNDFNDYDSLLDEKQSSFYNNDARRLSSQRLY